ncbi:MAG TPA: hypothetical protein VFO85_04810, partial [Vicinamibacteria bacterium]|nr:hypothetical protein [Vicinamibacteria bacterium]
MADHRLALQPAQHALLQQLLQRRLRQALTGAAARAGQRLSEPALEQLLQESVLRGLQGKSMVSHPIFSTSLKEPLIVLSEP